MFDEKLKLEKIIDQNDSFLIPGGDDSKIEDLDFILSKGEVKSFRLFSTKQKDLISNINGNVDVFINDYNKYFFEKFFSTSFKQIEKLMDENYEKKNTIHNNYNDQIEDMQKLLNFGKIKYFID